MKIRWARLLFGALLATASCGSAEKTPGGACKTQGDCVDGEACISGLCRVMSAPGCTTDDDCALGEMCDPDAKECVSIGPTPDGGMVTPDAGEIPKDAGPGVDAGPNPDGGPLDFGMNACTMDNECGTPPVDICVGNTCVKGCAEPNGLMCTGGTVCNPATGHCEGQNMCFMDSECGPPQQICEGNQCVLGCGMNPGLCDPVDEVCDTNTGRCVLVNAGCTSDTGCAPPMTVCESMQCVPGCSEAGGIQCTGTTPLCDSTTGRCVAPQMCSDDSGCMPPQTICENLQCVPGCGEPNGPTCTGATPMCNATTGRCEPVGGGCSLDTECQAMDPNTICVNSTCILRCDAPGGMCLGNDACNAADGRCLPGNLALGTNCSVDSQCQTDFCLPVTIDMASVSICSTPCGRSADCPLGFGCIDLNNMGFCIEGTRFTPPNPFNTPAGGTCNTTTNNCQSGWCNTGTNQCLATCSKSAHCSSFGGRCWNYEQAGTGGPTFENLCFVPGTDFTQAAGTTCTLNTNCQSGICNRYDTECAAHCCSDSDCPSTQNCTVYDHDANNIVKICRDKDPTSGNLVLGATCSAPEDCDSEACVAIDPANMASARKCSTTCCTNADCSVLPLGGTCIPATGPGTNTLVGVCKPN